MEDRAVDADPSTMTITLNSDVTGTTVYYGLWIDWAGEDPNHNLETYGVFYSGSVVVNSPTDTTFNVDVPNSYEYDKHVYVRLRADDQPFTAADFENTRVNGEVEDYWFEFDNGGQVTPITLSYFQAWVGRQSVRFGWETATETGNLGFNIYVDNAGSLERLNENLIPSAVINSTVPQEYYFYAETKGDVFYIEDVSVKGETELHGPFKLFRQVGLRDQVEPLIQQDVVNTEHTQKEEQRQDALVEEMAELPDEVFERAPVFSILSASVPQLTATLNLEVSETGIHRVTYEDLRNAGLDLAGVPVDKIALFNAGAEVPVYVYSSEKTFGDGAYIEFYGEALHTLYADTNIYTIQVLDAKADRIKEKRAAPVNTKDVVSVYYQTDELGENNKYNFASPSPDDPWYDTQMYTYDTPKSWEFTFNISDFYTGGDDAFASNLGTGSNGTNPPNAFGGGPINISRAANTVRLNLWSTVDFPGDNLDHHLIISVNGVQLFEEEFEGLLVEKDVNLPLPDELLQEGENTLKITLVGDTGVPYDLLYLNNYSVSYRRWLSAVDGRLTFEAAGKTITVTDLPSDKVVVYRLDDGDLTRLDKVEVTQDGETFTAAFAGIRNTAATYLVSVEEALYTPVFTPARQLVDIDQPAQYVMISHPDFIEGLTPLVQVREAQGYTVNVVDVEDIYAQYAGGVVDPYAIKDYIAHAKAKLGTEYVLLVGGDTYDYHNYLGVNSVSFIPSFYRPTEDISRFTPVDPLYADVDDDNVPDLAIGRFPVRTTAELALVIQKTFAYEQKDYGKTATFAADTFDGIESYKSISIGLADALPDDWQTEGIYLDDLSVTTARQQLLDAMNRGTALVTYTGHSAPSMWSFERLLLSSHAASLTNHGQPFVAVQWGCFNTYYVEPLYTTLVDSFLFSGDNGAAALMGASGRTSSESEMMLGTLLNPRLVVPGATMGNAMLEAKQELAETHPEMVDVFLGWTLMGDPTLVVEP
jgi:hypothetical protein